MRELRIGDHVVNDQSDPFIVAEIGSNHMGDFKVCLEMIRTAARCGVQAVKMQKRNNREMFTKTGYNRPYDNELSYGKTYGEHRDKLDNFTPLQWKKFRQVATECGVLFFATPFEQDSLTFLDRLDVPLYKVASCDVTNIPLIRSIAEKGKPIIISTGGSTLHDISRVYHEINHLNSNIAFLHCVSTYPNRDEDLNLDVISSLRINFPNNVIGFSSHHPGIMPNFLACQLGASIFEVHFTMNRANRGTDHGYSLEPHALEKLCEDLPRVKRMVGLAKKKVLEEERTGFVLKMGKSCYPAHSIKAGTGISDRDIIIKSPGGGLPPYQRDNLIGRVAARDLTTGIPFSEEDFE